MVRFSASSVLEMQCDQSCGRTSGEGEDLLGLLRHVVRVWLSCLPLSPEAADPHLPLPVRLPLSSSTTTTNVSRQLADSTAQSVSCGPADQLVIFFSCWVYEGNYSPLLVSGFPSRQVIGPIRSSRRLRVDFAARRRFLVEQACALQKGSALAQTSWLLEIQSLLIQKQSSHPLPYHECEPEITCVASRFCYSALSLTRSTYLART
jgi:hypothetical protein